MKLTDRLAVVTGGAHGIGAGLALRFAAEGARQVAVLDIDGQGARAVAERFGGLAYAVDVSDEHALRTVLEDIASREGPIDLMCSNAGIAQEGGFDITNDDWERIWQINVMAHVYATRALLPSMLERGEGYFLTTASAAGLLSNIGALSYSVTKHGAVALAEWLSITYGDRGIRASCLCPMGVDTNMLNGFDTADKLLRPNAISVEAVADATIQGLDNEDFFILPHPEVQQFVEHRALDHARWMAGMRKLQHNVLGDPSNT